MVNGLICRWFRPGKTSRRPQQEESLCFGGANVPVDGRPHRICTAPSIETESEAQFATIRARCGQAAERADLRAESTTKQSSSLSSSRSRPCGRPLAAVLRGRRVLPVANSDPVSFEASTCSKAEHRSLRPLRPRLREGGRITLPDGAIRKGAPHGAPEWRGSLLLPTSRSECSSFPQWSAALTPRDLAPLHLHFRFTLIFIACSFSRANPQIRT